MNKNEVKEALRHYAKVFSGRLNATEGAALAPQLFPYRLDAAKEAMDEQRTKLEWPNLSALISTLREGRRREVGDGSGRNNQSWWDQKRQHAPHLAQCGDVETTIRFFRSLLFENGSSFVDGRRCQDKRPHAWSEGYQSQFSRECVERLGSSGVAKDQIAPLVKAVFDPDMDFFRLVLDEVREKYPKMGGADERPTAARSTEQTEVEAYL